MTEYFKLLLPVLLQLGNLVIYGKVAITAVKLLPMVGMALYSWRARSKEKATAKLVSSTEEPEHEEKSNVPDPLGPLANSSESDLGQDADP